MVVVVAGAYPGGAVGNHGDSNPLLLLVPVTLPSAFVPLLVRVVLGR